ncbi:hypothetical protein [Dactylosporangium darangshiense]
MQIRRADVGDAAAIAHVHVQSWQSAYRGLITQDYLDGLDVGLRRQGWERILGGALPARAAMTGGSVERCLEPHRALREPS